jgi:Flp pilus assembly pilin Flp
MRDLLRKLWKDDAGALLATEWLFLATILVIGVVVGLVVLRNAVASEMTEFGNAVTSLNMGFRFPGLIGPIDSSGRGDRSCSAVTFGSEADDHPDRTFLRTTDNQTPVNIENDLCGF